jgi:hypothetical protein
MNQAISRTFLLAALTLPAFAQEPTTKAPAASAPLMVLKTPQSDIAGMMAMSFEVMEELPELGDGEHYVLTLDGAREFKIAKAKGDVGVLTLTADPGLLMDAYAEEIEATKPMINGSLTMVLQQGGIAPKDSAAMIKSFFDFPRQMAQVSLHVTGNVENPADGGLDLAFAFEGKAGSGYAGFLEALKPCSLGAPVLPTKGAMVQMQCSLAPQSLMAMFAPFKDLAVNMTSQGDEQRAKAGQVMDQWLALYDGGMSMVFDSKFQGAALVGLTDAGKAQQLMASDDYAAMMKGQKLPNRDMEMEITLDALEHRGCKLARTKISGMEPNPMMKDGSLESYFGTFGEFMGLTLGGGEAGAKSLVDMVADKKVARAALPNGVLMHMVMDMQAMIAMQMEQMGMDAEPDESMPKQMTMSLGKTSKALTLHVHVQ